MRIEGSPIGKRGQHFRAIGRTPSCENPNIVEGQERPDDRHQHHEHDVAFDRRDDDREELAPKPGTVDFRGFDDALIDLPHRRKEYDREEPPPMPAIDEHTSPDRLSDLCKGIDQIRREYAQMIDISEDTAPRMQYHGPKYCTDDNRADDIGNKENRLQGCSSPIDEQ